MDRGRGKNCPVTMFEISRKSSAKQHNTPTTTKFDHVDLERENRLEIATGYERDSENRDSSESLEFGGTDVWGFRFRMPTSRCLRCPAPPRRRGPVFATAARIRRTVIASTGRRRCLASAVASSSSAAAWFRPPPSCDWWRRRRRTYDRSDAVAAAAAGVAARCSAAARSAETSAAMPDSEAASLDLSTATRILFNRRSR